MNSPLGSWVVTSLVRPRIVPNRGTRAVVIGAKSLLKNEETWQLSALSKTCHREETHRWQHRNTLYRAPNPRDGRTVQRGCCLQWECKVNIETYLRGKLQ